MKILLLSTSDLAGGAEKVAWTLLNAYRERGHTAHLVVGHKRSTDPNVISLNKKQPPAWAHLCWVLHGRLAPLEARIYGIRRFRYWLSVAAQGLPALQREIGLEDFNFPDSRHLLRKIPFQPDIIHANNLHGNYFDLRILPQLSQKIPVVLRLADAWLLSGHCAHSFDCVRWQTGCGNCPDLTIYPAIKRDATDWNWRRKQRIYRQSHLYAMTPSQWLMEKVKRSMLHPVEARMIHNGVDLTIYHPAEREAVRSELGLEPNVFIILFAAHGTKSNRFKDYATVEQAVRQVAGQQNSERPLLFLALGGREETVEPLGAGYIRHIPFQSDPRQVARYYQAADVFLHAAHADTFPNTVIESLACGTPVIATAVGGIPEQIEDGVTGYLVPPQGSQTMAARINQLQADDDLRKRLGQKATEIARSRFDLNRQVEESLNWYQEIILAWQKEKHTWKRPASPPVS